MSKSRAAHKTPILLVGAGHMGGALLRGWVARKLPVIVIEPNPSAAIKALVAKHRLLILRNIDGARARAVRACVIALKPQILKPELAMFKTVAASGVPMISIAAGVGIKAMTSAWGTKAHVIRAMPNVAGAVGKAISGLFAGRNATEEDKALAVELLSAIGETVWVPREALIDSVTAVSGSGPAYVFLMVEALAAAAMNEGLPRPAAERLARQTIIGAGALLEADPRSPRALRESVTSPAGTTEAALKVLTGEGFEALIARAVAAARKRGAELGA